MNLIEVYHDTVNKTKNLKTEILTDKYNLERLSNVKSSNQNRKGKVYILNEDCIQTTIDLIRSRNFPALLNLADNRTPGGCVHAGSRTQEECIFRTTDLWRHIGDYEYNLNDMEKYYPLKGSDCLYSSNVSIVKNKDLKNIKHLTTSVITMPGINQPSLINGKFNEKDRKFMEEKIETIFKVAIYNNHNSIVLGALGCGVWLCPKEEVIEIFNKYISIYKKEFDYIVFAIKSDHNDSNSNYNIFKKLIKT